jgi:carboxypeptidase C (cathepsin A)
MDQVMTGLSGFGQNDPADQPLMDNLAYGSGPDDAITDTSEGVAVTHRVLSLGGVPLHYTAYAGHLVAVDPVKSTPAAKFFYVAYVADNQPAAGRPVTFFYNGGPGSSSVFLLLGSFGPRRIHTSMPGITPPPPYRMEDNPDSLLDRSDLVFINPIGTGYSAAIAPFKNRDFWGVDQDARSIRQFIKRFLTAYNRWNSPKFLFGESYGTARTCVLAWLLHEDGIELNGITLQSSVLDYTATFGNVPGLLPTLAADAWYQNRTGVSPKPTDLAAYMDTVATFAAGPYAQALKDFPNANADTVATLSRYLGLPATTLNAWSLNVTAQDRLGNNLFLTSLLQDQGKALGAYDGRVTGFDTGIAAIVDPDGGSNDPTIAAVSGVYTAMWNTYLNTELKYTSSSNFTDLNDQAFRFWDFSHKDPAGVVQLPDQMGNPTLNTTGDLAATLDAFPFMRVLSANGYYDSVTPFFSTKQTLAQMVADNPATGGNITIRNYPSGHMIYLDNASRTALKADLAVMYDAATAQVATRRRAARALSRVVKDGIAPYFVLRPKPGPGLHAAVADQSWTVANLCAAYAWPTKLVGGGVIALIELDGGWVQGDIDAYFQTTNLPKPNIVDVSVGPARNNPNQSVGNPSDPDVEVTLDILIAAASYSIATGKPAEIRVYWASNADWGSMALAIAAAAADGCDVCSISWGSDEANWQAAGAHLGTDYVRQLDNAAQAAARNGMLVVAAAGDNDSSDGGTSPANVDLPASSPNVIACGGTRKASGGAETVWNNSPGNPNGQGTGGGFSRLFTPMPLWQANAPHGRGRMVPDVSANADPDTGYKIVVHGGEGVVGGTSAVAPLYAGLFAAFGRKPGFVDPKLWANQTAFVDVTAGDNGFYRATPGPDPCTGLGVPVASRLADLFNAPKQSIAAADDSASAVHETSRVHGGRAKHASQRHKVGGDA